VNIENVALETVYLFPMDIKAIISKLTCQFTMPDGSISEIETIVEEREKAQVKFDDAVAKGKTAVIS